MMPEGDNIHSADRITLPFIMAMPPLPSPPQDRMSRLDDVTVHPANGWDARMPQHNS